ncbi:ATP-binding cassette domain-containing protein [Paraoerskovia sediminicola]|uniref:ATP-binding cassette domain-containing protein n=1 Tax=Paraoerskovia sediminicola TaxID=1138587 RepID=UPI003D9BD784
MRLGPRLLSRTPRVPLRPEPGAVVAQVRGVSLRLGGSPVLEDVDLDVRAGEVRALIGPNGAGKSSLLGVLTGDVEPDAGDVVVHDRPAHAWSTTELAMRRAVLMQNVSLAFPFTSEAVVRMGRAPWQRTPAEDEDDDAVTEALHLTDTTHLAGRTFPTLSGANALAWRSPASSPSAPAPSCSTSRPPPSTSATRSSCCRSRGPVLPRATPSSSWSTTWGSRPRTRTRSPCSPTVASSPTDRPATSSTPGSSARSTTTRSRSSRTRGRRTDRPPLPHLNHPPCLTRPTAPHPDPHYLRTGSPCSPDISSRRRAPGPAPPQAPRPSCRTAPLTSAGSAASRWCSSRPSSRRSRSSASGRRRSPRRPRPTRTSPSRPAR